MTTPSSSNEPRVRTNWVFMKPAEISGKVSTDQSGRFPTTSSKGNKYLMVLHEYDSNAILAEPMKNRSEVEIVRSYTTLHEYLCSRGLKPTLHVLENECPAGLKKFMAKAEKLFNWSLCIATAPTMPRKPSAPSRNTSSPEYLDTTQLTHAPLGPQHPPSYIDPQSSPPLTHQSAFIGRSPIKWVLQFQCHPACSPRDQGPHL